MAAQHSRLKRIIGASSLALTIFIASAPHALAQVYNPYPVNAGQARVLSAQSFLGDEWMQGPLHSVAPCDGEIGE